MVLVRQSDTRRTRPVPRGPARRWSSAAARWLWAGVALGIGLFIGGGGAPAWILVAGTTLAGLFGVARRARWALTVLWIGVGLCLGLCLHLTLELALPDRAAALWFG